MSGNKRCVVGNLVLGLFIVLSLITKSESTMNYPYLIDNYVTDHGDAEMYGLWLDDNHELFSGHQLSVRKFDGTNPASIIAGTADVTASSPIDGGSATSGFLANVYSLVGGAVGSVNSFIYFCNSGQATVRKVMLNSNIITTIAGRKNSGEYSVNGDGGSSTAALLSYPQGIAWRRIPGELFFSDAANSLANIRKVATDGIITSFMRRDGTNGDTGNGGAYSAATIKNAKSMFFVGNDKLYFSTVGCQIRMVDFNSGNVILIAGNNCATGETGAVVAATSAKLYENPVITADTNGVVYLMSSDSTVRKVADGIVTLIAGVENSLGEPTPGMATASTLTAVRSTSGLAIDTAGNLFLGTTTAKAVRRLASTNPTAQPSMVPSSEPSVTPSVAPSVEPTLMPSEVPSVVPSAEPSVEPTVSPSQEPSASPSAVPSVQPTAVPSSEPSATPSVVPSADPSASPSAVPSVQPTPAPSSEPSASPSATPSAEPSASPNVVPSLQPTAVPSSEPSATPSVSPSEVPSVEPSVEPTVTPTPEPSVKPSRTPSVKPTVRPSKGPSARPSLKPSPPPTVVFQGLQVGANVTVQNVIIEENGGRRRLSRAGSMLLMEASDNAIVKTVAEALGLSEAAVSIESEHIVSNVDNVATVLVELKILAPNNVFAMFADVEQAFSDAVAFNALSDKMKAVAEDIGAYELYQITAVNIDALANEGAVDTSVSDKDGDDLTTGYLAGLVIGVIVAFLVLFALVYLCISAGTGGDKATTSSVDTGTGTAGAVTQSNDLRV